MTFSLALVISKSSYYYSFLTQGRPKVNVLLIFLGKDLIKKVLCRLEIRKTSPRVVSLQMGQATLKMLQCCSCKLLSCRIW